MVDFGDRLVCILGRIALTVESAEQQSSSDLASIGSSQWVVVMVVDN